MTTVLGGRRGHHRTNLTNQRALHPKAAGLIEEAFHLRGHHAKAGACCKNDGIVVWEDGTGFGTYFTPGAVLPNPDKKRIQKRVDTNTDNLHYSKGFFYGTSCSDNDVFRIDSKGRYTSILSNVMKEKVGLNCPTSIFQSRKGGFYIADSGNKRIL